MAATIKLSQLPTVQNLDNSDFLLITDVESSTSRKVTVGDFKNNIFSGDSIDAFSNVDLTSTPPTDGQFLRYNASDNKWKAGDISLSSLGELADVDLVTITPSPGETLIWDGTKFTPGEIDLSPLYSILGEDAGDTHLGVFVNSPYLEDNKNLRQHLQSLSNAIVAETSARGGDVDAVTVALTNVDNRLQTAETSVSNLEVAMAPETLNSINELAAALGDDPAAFATLQTNVTNLENNLLASIANVQSDVNQNESDADVSFASVSTEQNTQDGRLDALEADFAALGTNLAPGALDSINELAATLQKLVPLPPTTLSGLPLVVNTNAGTKRLCVGFTDRTGGTSGYTAGDQVKRNTDGSITTDKIEDVGPGDSGDITVKISDNSYSVSTTMASGTQVVDFMGLKITDNKDANLSTRDAGIAEGFYQVYDIQLVNAALQNQTDGLHYVEYDHAGNKTQKAYFYEDESTPGAPTLNTSSMYMPASPIYNYSSGVPHYSNVSDNEFSYSLFAENLSGEMYTNHTVATSSQTSGFTHEGNKTYTDFGGTNPPAANFAVGDQKITNVNQYPRDLHITVTSNQFSNWTVSTPYGSASKRPSIAMSFNIMGNTARTNVMDEDNILISGVGSGAGNATRVSDGAGDNPSPAPIAWDASATPSIHEATVVGGILKHDRTDYSGGYRPVGPNLSTRSLDPQYAEFDIRRSGVSQFTINYTGNCDGCWVTMPNNTAWQTSLSGTNGWADMFQSYRGSGVPTSAESGCSSGGVMDNNGGSFTCVFGTESSSNDSENRILVRWKLSSGQAINTMSFTA